MNLPTGEGLSMFIKALQENNKGRTAYYVTLFVISLFALDDLITALLPLFSTDF